MCHQTMIERPHGQAPVRVPPRPQGSALEAAQAVERTALWSTRRIRFFLLSQQIAGPASR
jgi:hypothetical protein